MSPDLPDQNDDAGAGGREEAVHAQLAQTEETRRAIRSGEVDALVVATPDGDRGFTLRGADEPYRIMLEQMSEGAASLSSDRVVLYANRRLADMLATELLTLVGSAIDQFIAAEQRAALVLCAPIFALSAALILAGAFLNLPIPDVPHVRASRKPSISRAATTGDDHARFGCTKWSVGSDFGRNVNGRETETDSGCLIKRTFPGVCAAGPRAPKEPARKRWTGSRGPSRPRRRR